MSRLRQLIFFVPWAAMAGGQVTTQEVESLVLVPVAQVGRHVGKEIAVEFEVRSSHLVDDRKICFLNSQKDYRKEGNFTVVIKGDVLDRFAELEIENPAEHFYGKQIRIRGKVTLHRERPQIVAEAPDQIKVLKSASDGEGKSAEN